MDLAVGCQSGCLRAVLGSCGAVSQCRSWGANGEGGRAGCFGSSWGSGFSPSVPLCQRYAEAAQTFEKLLHQNGANAEVAPQLEACRALLLVGVPSVPFSVSAVIFSVPTPWA